MRILLLDPGMTHPRFSNNRFLNRGLLSIAGFLKGHGVDVELFSLDQYYLIGRVDFEAAFGELCHSFGCRQYDVIGVSSVSIHEFPYAAQIINRLKRVMPSAVSVIGGYLPTFETDLVLKEHPYIDYAITGEGEWAFLNLIRFVESGKRAGELRSTAFYDRATEKTIHHERLPPGDLAELPPVDYSILPMGYLRNEPPPNVNIEFNRGCRQQCSFCSARQFWPGPVRKHDIRKIVTELKQLSDLKYRGKISFEDETIDLRTDYFKKFLRELLDLERKYEFRYVVTRYDHMDAESLNLMRRVGFSEIVIGLETASPELLRRVRKKIDLDDFREAAVLVNEAGLNLNIFLIVGLPGETERTSEETYAYVEDLFSNGLISNVFVSHYQPYACTDAFEDLRLLDGRVLVGKNDFSEWLLRSRPLVEYPHLAQQQLQDMFDRLNALNSKSASRFIDDF